MNHLAFPTSATPACANGPDKRPVLREPPPPRTILLPMPLESSPTTSSSRPYSGRCPLSHVLSVTPHPFPTTACPPGTVGFDSLVRKYSIVGVNIKAKLFAFDAKPTTRPHH